MWQSLGLLLLLLMLRSSEAWPTVVSMPRDGGARREKFPRASSMLRPAAPPPPPTGTPIVHRYVLDGKCPIREYSIATSSLGPVEDHPAGYGPCESERFATAQTMKQKSFPIDDADRRVISVVYLRLSPRGQGRITFPGSTHMMRGVGVPLATQSTSFR
ncbi:hypothetical protein EYF80_054475 [Liparis tanakae]|uniref:Uncharacterized protein n=1 Tax=Liparis tanakae TaxID=230148 RepID=A0A4Z2F2T0_9TELE|nr:hypothetical protein EYF80_054475 [Liparis tanakae]